MLGTAYGPALIVTRFAPGSFIGEADSIRLGAAPGGSATFPAPVLTNQNDAPN